MAQMKDIEAFFPELEENYKYLHQRPELGFEEHETSAYILQKLAEYGIEGKQVARTGIIATIEGCAPGKTVAIRADIDALPIEEKCDLPYRSRNGGRMHACGHDSHATMLLGAAHYLSQHRDQFKGKVRLIFQPAEEGFDMKVLQEVCKEGGDPRGGAASMIAFGALEGVDACFALHVNPAYPTGSIYIPENRLSASSDIFELTIQGKGGHGSAPEAAVDPTGAGYESLAAFSASEDPSALGAVMFAMSIGIMAGMVCNIFLTKRICKTANSFTQKSGPWGALAISCFLTCMMCTFLPAQMISGIIPLLTVIVSAAVTIILTKVAIKMNIRWLADYIMSFALIIGMAAAVVFTNILA